MRILVTIAALAVLTGCSGETTSTEAPLDTADPAAVAGDWLDAVARGDGETATLYVEQDGLAIFAAVESNLRSEELVALLRDGMEPALETQYWSDFATDFSAFSGTTISDLVVGTASAVPGHADFVSVSVAGPAGEGRVVLRNLDAGWLVDFAATVGPAIVGPLGEYLAVAGEGEHAEEIGLAFVESIVPGLEAAAAIDPEDSRLVFEAEYIRQLAGS